MNDDLAREQRIADITQEVAPDLGRAIARLEAFCATQHDPNPPRSTREIPPNYPGINYADVRAAAPAIGRNRSNRPYQLGRK